MYSVNVYPPFTYYGVRWYHAIDEYLVDYSLRPLLLGFAGRADTTCRGMGDRVGFANGMEYITWCNPTCGRHVVMPSFDDNACDIKM